MNKKSYIASLVGIVILLSALSGFMIGYTFNNIDNKENKTYIDEINEYLTNEYYKEIDYDNLDLVILDGIISSLDDPYTYYVDSYYSGVLGINIKKYNGDYIVYTVDPDYELGNVIYPNDIVIKINDKNIYDMTLIEIKEELKGNVGESIDLTFKRGDLVFNETLTFKEMINKTVVKDIIDSKGYIHIKSFKKGTAIEFKECLDFLESQNIDELIIDLRGNLGGKIEEVNNILQNFITGYNKMFSLYFIKENKTLNYFPNTSTVKKDYEISILVDNNSASSSEIFASTMSEIMGYNIYGELTYGKGVFQDTVELKKLSGYYLTYTKGYWYTANDNSVHKIGITPDIVIDDYIDDYIIYNAKNYHIDDVSNNISSIQNMLKLFGYDGRVDGYFDNDLKNYLINNYGSSELTVSLIYQISNEYYNLKYENKGNLLYNKNIDRVLEYVLGD